MEKNYLNRVVWVVLAVVLVLLGLYWLPEIKIGDWTMRKVDLLADLRNGAAPVEPTATGTAPNPDSLTVAQKAALKLPLLDGSRLTHDQQGNVVTVEDSIMSAMAALSPQRKGVTSIIDMSGGEPGGMTMFYEALAQSDSRTVRIAVLGDSFIEGDILTGMLRELLQQRFGGSGCGFLPMASPATSSFRRSVRQSSQGWSAHRTSDRAGYMATYNNITGSYFNGSDGAWVDMEASGANYRHSGSCTSTSFYYLGGGAMGSVTAFVNGINSGSYSLSSNDPVGVVTVRGNITQAKWQLGSSAGIVFLGASMDGDRGVAVDNLALRSTRGYHLTDVSDRILTGFNQVRPYDLVVIMYGLNIAFKGRRNFGDYCKRMDVAIDNIKRCMPGAGILLVSCSDHAERGSDGLRTMPEVLALNQAQKRVAINNRIAFWDLYSAMSGVGGITGMVSRGEASSDYTHLNFKGGDHLARLLYDAIILGYENR